MGLLKRNNKGVAMKFLKYLFSIITVVVVIGLLLPSHTHVERSVIIQAPANAVFPYINNFSQFNKWSPWARKDPNTTYEFSGPESGVNSEMSWQSEHPEVGIGSQKIIASRPYQSVQVFLDFGGKGEAQASYQLEQVSSGTKITWSLDMDHGWDLLGRIFGLMMDGMVGPDYEAGLSNLKQVAEADTAG